MTLLVSYYSYNIYCHNKFINYPGSTHYHHSEFGEGTGENYNGYLSCYGSKYRLKDCSYSNSTEDDSHSRDLNVYCGRG